MLDDLNIIVQCDPQNALLTASEQWKQTKFNAEIINPEHDNREIKNIIITGMGGSALAALIVKKWLATDIYQPLEIIHDYKLPKSATANTLVIASSYSGNTEETIAAHKSVLKSPQLALMANLNKLLNLMILRILNFLKAFSLAWRCFIIYER